MIAGVKIRGGGNDVHGLAAAVNCLDSDGTGRRFAVVLRKRAQASLKPFRTECRPWSFLEMLGKCNGAQRFRKGPPWHRIVRNRLAYRINPFDNPARLTEAQLQIGFNQRIKCSSQLDHPLIFRLFIPITLKVDSDHLGGETDELQRVTGIHKHSSFFIEEHVTLIIKHFDDDAVLDRRPSPH